VTFLPRVSRLQFCIGGCTRCQTNLILARIGPYKRLLNCGSWSSIWAPLRSLTFIWTPFRCGEYLGLTKFKVKQCDWLFNTMPVPTTDMPNDKSTVYPCGELTWPSKTSTYSACAELLWRAIKKYLPILTSLLYVFLQGVGENVLRTAFSNRKQLHGQVNSPWGETVHTSKISPGTPNWSTSFHCCSSWRYPWEFVGVLEHLLVAGDGEADNPREISSVKWSTHSRYLQAPGPGS
jgi:hypothetical protein